MKNILPSLAAAAVLAITTPAMASPTEAASVTVQHDDLNLESVRGQKTLERRLNRAARSVCGIDDAVSGTRIRSEATNQCYRQARAGAMRSYAALMRNYRLGG